MFMKIRQNSCNFRLDDESEEIDAITAEDLVEPTTTTTAAPGKLPLLLGRK